MDVQQNGCTVSQQYDVDVNPIPANPLSIASTSIEICEGDSVDIWGDVSDRLLGYVPAFYRDSTGVSYITCDDTFSVKPIQTTTYYFICT